MSGIKSHSVMMYIPFLDKIPFSHDVYSFLYVSGFGLLIRCCGVLASAFIGDIGPQFSLLSLVLVSG